MEQTYFTLNFTPKPVLQNMQKWQCFEKWCHVMMIFTHGLFCFVIKANNEITETADNITLWDIEL